MNNNWKNIYLVILSIVTVVSIIVGSLYHIVGAFESALRHVPFVRETISDEWTEYEEYYDEASSIALDLSLMNVEIEPGERLRVSYEGSKRLSPKITLEGGVLSIEQDKSGGENTLARRWSDRVIDGDLTIEIPEDVTLDILDIDLALGEIDIDDVHALTSVIEANMGNVTIDTMTSDNIHINANMGNVEIEEAQFLALDINADMGNVSVESRSPLSSYDITATASLGNVEVGDKRVATNDTYRSSVEGEPIGTIHVTCSMGNIGIYEY